MSVRGMEDARAVRGRRPASAEYRMLLQFSTNSANSRGTLKSPFRLLAPHSAHHSGAARETVYTVLRNRNVDPHHVIATEPICKHRL